MNRYLFLRILLFPLDLALYLWVMATLQPFEHVRALIERLAS